MPPATGQPEVAPPAPSPLSGTRKQKPRGGQARAHRWDRRGSLDFRGKALVGFSVEDTSSSGLWPVPC